MKNILHDYLLNIFFQCVNNFSALLLLLYKINVLSKIFILGNIPNSHEIPIVAANVRIIQP